MAIFRMILALSALLAWPAASPATDIRGPAGSVAFGSPTVLPNGNLLIVDRNGVGAIHLYSGAGKHISTLKGSRQDDLQGARVTVLENGNAVVSSVSWDNGQAVDAGAVVWIDARQGRAGVIGPHNALVGSRQLDIVGYFVLALSNGNYVVASPLWQDVVSGSVVVLGAYTFARGDSGVIGLVDESNSMIGGPKSSSSIYITLQEVGGGNYVVSDPYAGSGGIPESGFAFRGDGINGTRGRVTASNALVGSTVSDRVGFRVTLLDDGNYVVGSHDWDNGSAADVGAATWCSADQPCSGYVMASNSLIGGASDDGTGIRIYPLSNGDYVVGSYWSDRMTGARNVGALTRVQGGGIRPGVVGNSNSLIGTHQDDCIGISCFPSAEAGVRELSNGDIVVFSPLWNGNRGAVTWISGDAPTFSGEVTVQNSMTGAFSNDYFGDVEIAAFLSSNGNFAVACPYCDVVVAGGQPVADAGLVRWAAGSEPTSGISDVSNSLTGRTPSDYVGERIVALTNGNYIVGSPSYDSYTLGRPDAGAITWVDGATGILSSSGTTHGVVEPLNSVVGSSAQERWGSSIVALANGHYVIASPAWDGGGVTDRGIVKWFDGRHAPPVGALSTNNALYGSSSGDRYGSAGILALPNGNFVTGSRHYDFSGLIDTGVVTWGKGDGSTEGNPSQSNSFWAAAPGSALPRNMLLLDDGNFAIRGDETGYASVQNAGSVTFGSADDGVRGPLSESNSIIGRFDGSGNNFDVAYDTPRKRLVVGKLDENVVSILDGRIFSDGFDD